MNGFRVLVTGSRTWDDDAAIEMMLFRILAVRGCLTLVHGGCPKGADKIAHNWGVAVQYAGSYGEVTLEPHPAIWRPDGVFDKTAGFRRNAEMVAAGADLCLAFIRDRSPGATHCSDLAEKAGIPVRRITSDALLAQRARMRAAEAIQDAAKAIREGRDDLARDLMAEGTGRLDALRGNHNGD